MKNGGILLEELISSCKDKWRYNPIRTYSAKEVLEATNHFQSHFCHAFYYKWYKGTLDHRPVLFKKYECQFEDRAYHDIAISSQMSSHRNVLKLLGCCLEFFHPILVYEYVDSGPLNSTGGTGSNFAPLSCNTRLKVAKGIAHAITYLNTGFKRPIIHRDINPSNIFLDKDFIPKLCNFDRSIAIPEGETYAEDKVIGTVGLLEPNYFRTRTVTEATDVYSFGVLLLILLTGKKAFDRERDENQQMLCIYVADMAEEGRYIDILDPKILEEDGGNNEARQLQLQTFLKLALRCIEKRREDRPLMIDATKELINIERSIRLLSTN